VLHISVSEVIDDDYKPNLFDIHRYFENYKLKGKIRRVIGNNETRMIIPLLFPLQKVSVVIKGSAGSGKSTLVQAAASLIWGEELFQNKVREILYIGGASDKAFLNDNTAQRISNVCTHCVIPELQNAISNERVEAIIKLWCENESYVYTRSTGGGTNVREYVLKPLPILTSIATENKYMEKLGEELERRFFPFVTVSNSKLNKEVHESKAHSRAYCDEDIIRMTDAEKESLRLHIRELSRATIKTKNPSATYTATAIPHNYVISNSMIDYWFDLVEAITKFYKPDRILYNREGSSNYLISTPVDNYIAWKLGGGSIVLASMNVPDLGGEILSILPLKDGENGQSLTANEITDALAEFGIERKKSQIQQIIRALESANYAKKDEYHTDSYYKTKPHNLDTGIDWAACIESTKKVIKDAMPDIADDYIHRFCSDPTFTDPFTNTKVRLLDIPVDAVAATVTQTKRKVDLSDFEG